MSRLVSHALLRFMFLLDLTLRRTRALDHILEYENYAGYDKTVAKIRNSDVSYIRTLLWTLADDVDG